jgi:hypothetical protein
LNGTRRAHKREAPPGGFQILNSDFSPLSFI